MVWVWTVEGVECRVWRLGSVGMWMVRNEEVGCGECRIRGIESTRVWRVWCVRCGEWRMQGLEGVGCWSSKDIWCNGCGGCEVQEVWSMWVV